MANAGVRGRPIAPLVLSTQERAYLERQVQRWRARMWLPSSAFTNTQLASGVADF
jgi:hypothetical protein